MDHTKEYTELAVQIGKLMERAEDLKRDNDSLRSALAEKTDRVERLREALYMICMQGVSDQHRSVELMFNEKIDIAREALAATAQDVTK